MKYCKVATVSELADGEAKSVIVDGEDLGVFRVGDEYRVIQNTCPHREGYLHEGAIENGKVTCPWHFAIFDLATGKVLEGPAEEDRRCYDVVVEGDDVKVALP